MPRYTKVSLLVTFKIIFSSTFHLETFLLLISHDSTRSICIIVQLLLFSQLVNLLVDSCCDQTATLLINYYAFTTYTDIIWFIYRGPTKGCQGRVMLTFENNISSKIGIRFDKQIPNGNDLGGLCEADHGFFCPG
uniref:Uncharacterized protein n=1 Tax=Oryza brachyantha TaxID=4533 RepID=J3NE05_ORYBR